MFIFGFIANWDNYKSNESKKVSANFQFIGQSSFRAAHFA